MAFRSEPNDSIVERITLARKNMSGGWVTVTDYNAEYPWFTAKEFDRLIELAGYGLTQVKFMEAIEKSIVLTKNNDDPNRAFKAKTKQ